MSDITGGEHGETLEQRLDKMTAGELADLSTLTTEAIDSYLLRREAQGVF